MSRVLIIGATGRVGRAVVAELLGMQVSVRALTRRPAHADLPPSVEVVPGDLTVPESLDVALQDVKTVFLVWTAGRDTVRAVVERVAQTGSRVVFLSSPHQTPHPFFQQPNPMAVLHADIERAIAAAGLASTIIRPGMFASNAAAWWGPQIRNGDFVRWPYARVETAPIYDRDIAVVAARTLCDARYAGGDYVLTGPEPLSQARQVETIGAAIGRRIRFEELSPAEFRREAADTWPPAVVDMLLRAWEAAQGSPAFVTTAVQDLLGTPARSFRQWAIDHAGAFGT